jgi:hypothetical protein
MWIVLVSELVLGSFLLQSPSAYHFKEFPSARPSLESLNIQEIEVFMQGEDNSAHVDRSVFLLNTLRFICFFYLFCFVLKCSFTRSIECSDFS